MADCGGAERHVESSRDVQPLGRFRLPSQYRSGELTPHPPSLRDAVGSSPRSWRFALRPEKSGLGAAQPATARTTADDRPIVLVVVFLILVLLLRAVVAPLILIGTVIVSYLAALGVGYFVFETIFDFPGSDPSLPLFAFVFLVALGSTTTSSSWHARARRRSSTAPARGWSRRSRSRERSFTASDLDNESE